MNLSVREAGFNDFNLIVQYFHSANNEFLSEMGIDHLKIPNIDVWQQELSCELSKPIARKNYYYLIWEESSKPIGHSNLSGIVYGEKAKIHLHIWTKGQRLKGAGKELLKKSIKIYFDLFELSEIICEPIYSNKAPNKTLIKIGFVLEKTYETIPGSINYFQKVNRYVLNKNDYEKNIICF
ncbi:MAG: GNAT family N-acetyltransferase [Fluviicola sp.]|nr:MAG: GNAT family N-acetyltransferase [Fluviicola sp.]